jgi:hypothetical protein
VLFAVALKRKASFDLKPGLRLGESYEVEHLLGRGTEGEVYRIRELGTGIHRAAKLYFSEKSPSGRSMVWYAKKLNKLRRCPVVLQYHHTQTLRLRNRTALCLISEFCEGEQLEQWVQAQRGRRLPGYVALHIFYELVKGLEEIHDRGEYHADVHTENILVRPRGVGFELKLVDFYDWGPPARYKQQQDVVDVVRVLYDLIGGRAHYGRQSEVIRYICGGLKRSLILKRFPSVKKLRNHLETFEWDLLP